MNLLEFYHECRSLIGYATHVQSAHEANLDESFERLVYFVTSRQVRNLKKTTKLLSLKNMFRQKPLSSSVN